MVIGFFNKIVSIEEITQFADVVEDLIGFPAVDLIDIFDGGLEIYNLETDYPISTYLKIVEIAMTSGFNAEIEITHVSENDFYKEELTSPFELTDTYTISTKGGEVNISYRKDYPTDCNYNEWVSKHDGYFYSM